MMAMLTIPKGVPKRYVSELESYQKQIQILIRNHQILTIRLKKTEDINGIKVIEKQLKTLEKLLIEWNSKQKPVIKKIRKLVKNLNNKKKNNDESEGKKCKSTSSDFSPQTTTSPVSSAEFKTPLSNMDKSRSKLGETELAKEKSDYDGEKNKSKEFLNSIKKAPVVKKKNGMVMKKYKKKGRKTASSTNSIRTTPSPLSSSEEWTKFTDPNLEIGSNQFRAHFSDNVKITHEETYKQLKKDNTDHDLMAELRDPLENDESLLKKLNINQFIHQLDMVTPNEFLEIEEKKLKIRERTFYYRNLTYIPELSEKKHRPNFSYLGGDMSSPPLLRTRRRQFIADSTTTVKTKPVRITRSTSDSRTTSPINSICSETTSSVKEEEEEEEEEESRSVPNESPSTLKANNIENTNNESSSKENTGTSKDILPNFPPPPPAQPSSTNDSLRSTRPVRQKRKLTGAQERELSKMEKRVKELRDAIKEFGPRTVATRKERSRRNEMIEEEATLSKKIAKLY